jgi:hypothetical protein
MCYVDSTCIEINTNRLPHITCSHPIATSWIVLFTIDYRLLFLIMIVITQKYYVSKIVNDKTHFILSTI